jgi:hypothetical protein
LLYYFCFNEGSEDETSGRMATKQLVSSARQHTCTSVGDGQRCLAEYNVTALEHPPCSLDFPQLTFCFREKKRPEKTTIHWRLGSHCKRDESTDRVIQRWFPGMLPKALQTPVKFCYFPKELHRVVDLRPASVLIS